MVFRQIIWLLVILSIPVNVFGWAQEHFGPVDKERMSWSPSWPDGTKDLLAHQSRMYSYWCNGYERFYFDADTKQINELLDMFSKLHMLDHEVWIEQGRQTTHSFNQTPVKYNAFFYISGGFGPSYLGLGEKEKTGWILPTLKIYVDDKGELLKQLKLPENLIVHSDIAECPKTKTQKPQRKPYVTRFVLEDGSPAAGANFQTKITLWKKGQPQGYALGNVGFQGIFEMFFSDEEMFGLKTGLLWLTATYGNHSTSPKPTDPKISIEYLAEHALLPEMSSEVSRKAHQEGTFTETFNAAYAHAKKYVVSRASVTSYYGRLLFEDGTPAILDPKEWKGRYHEIFISLPYNECRPDKDGYFKAIYSEDQFKEFSEKKPSRNIYVPRVDEPNTGTAIARYPVGLLSPDKASAGVVKIPKPEPPKPELSEAKPLKGRPLPNWNGIKPDGQLTAEGKQLLVCFWDAGQRPSRNLLRQLQKKTDILEEKSISVLLISPANSQDATAWLKKNNIAYPAGQITGDLHDIRMKWNVRALPWLILTDTEHTVIAEGFNIDELARL